MNDRCEMCSDGEGSGGYPPGVCGYCDGTGEGVCRECGYPATQQTPSSSCMNHGVSREGLEHGRNVRATHR